MAHSNQTPEKESEFGFLFRTPGGMADPKPPRKSPDSPFAVIRKEKQKKAIAMRSQIARDATARLKDKLAAFPNPLNAQFEAGQYEEYLPAAVFDSIPSDAEEPMPMEYLRGLRTPTSRLLELPETEEDDGESAVTRRRKARAEAETELRRAFSEPTLTLEDLTPYRIKAVYRIVREIARQRGLLSPDESLMDALEPEYVAPDSLASPKDGSEPHCGAIDDPWIVPREINPPQNRQGGNIFRANFLILGLMEDARRIPLGKQPYQATLIQHEDGSSEWVPVHYPGLALLPPAVPAEYILEDNSIHPEYDPGNPQHDPALHHYIKIMRATAASLYIDHGSEKDPNLGRYGLAQIFNPYMVRMLFPSRAHLMIWETMLVEDILQTLVDIGQPQTRIKIREEHGLQPLEISQLVTLAKLKAREMTQNDVEEDRAMMVLRFESAITRARGSLDIRAEVAILKNLAIVQGLGRVEPDNALEEFVSVVREASQNNRRNVENMAERRSLDE